MFDMIHCVAYHVINLSFPIAFIIICAICVLLRSSRRSGGATVDFRDSLEKCLPVAFVIYFAMCIINWPPNNSMYKHGISIESMQECMPNINIDRCQYEAKNFTDISGLSYLSHLDKSVNNR